MSQGRLKQLLPDGSTGGMVVSKALSLNLNFNFINRISLLVMSSSYPIVCTRLGGPRSKFYISRKICRLLPGIEQILNIELATKMFTKTTSTIKDTLILESLTSYSFAAHEECAVVVISDVTVLWPHFILFEFPSDF